MEKCKSIIRIIVLIALLAIAFCLFLGEEDGVTLGSFIVRVLVDKVMAVGLGYLSWVLLNRWREDELISRFFSCK